MATRNTGGVNVPISATWNGKAIKQAESQLTGFRKSFSKAFTGVGAAVGGAIAIGSIVDQMRQMATAAAEDQKSVVALGKTLSNLGMGSQAREVEEFVRSVMLATGKTDDELRPAMSRLLRSTMDVTEAQKALGIAMDINAAIPAKDLDTIVNGLGKAYDGNAASLGRLGLGLDKALLKSGDMSKIMDELNRKFGGQAAAAADTYAGKLQRINTAVGEAQETIGYELLRSLDSVSKALGGTDGAISLITEFGESTANVAAGVGEMADAVATLSTGLNDLGLGDGGLFDTIKWMYALNPITASLGKAFEDLGDRGAEARRKIEMGQAFSTHLSGIRDRFVDLAVNAGLIDRNLQLVVDDLGGVGRAADTATSAVDRLRESFDRLNGRNRSVVRDRIDMRRLLAEGPTGTGPKGAITRDDRLTYALELADQAEQTAADLRARGRKGDRVRARRVVGNTRRRIAGMFGGDFASDILTTPTDLASTGAGYIRGQEGARAANRYEVNYNGPVTIVADTNAELVKRATQAQRRQGLNGGRNVSTGVRGMAGAA